MDLINLDNAEFNERLYGGVSCQKTGITLHGKYYLVKFPGNLKLRSFKNIDVSYSNSSVCEYLGSRILQLLGLPVHNTRLGFLSEKLVVVCEDFCEGSIRLGEFRELKATFRNKLFDEKGNQTDGTGAILADTLQVIRQHPSLKKFNTEEFFWKMWIGDAIIGNPDRNNGNWGVLLDMQDAKIVALAPIYDNGNCLNNKWDDNKMLKFLNDEKLLRAEAYTGKQFFFTDADGKKLNYFKVIEAGRYAKCTEALAQLLPVMNGMDFETLIDSVDLLTEIQNIFYKTLIRMRIKELNRIYEKLRPE